MTDETLTANLIATATPAWLRAALESRGLSQQALARLTGCDPRTIRRWCDPRRTAPLRPAPVALIRAALTRHDSEAATTATKRTRTTRATRAHPPAAPQSHENFVLQPDAPDESTAAPPDPASLPS